jgi:hypothetical protein
MPKRRVIRAEGIGTALRRTLIVASPAYGEGRGVGSDNRFRSLNRMKVQI